MKNAIYLWGFYNCGNFGDDLMFLIYANHYKNKGFKILTNCENKSLLGSEATMLAECVPIEKVQHALDFIIIGGGCLFKKVEKLRLFRSRQARMFEREIKSLRVTAESKGYAIHILSVGSDDNKLDELSKSRLALLNSPQVKSIKFRLKRDVKRLNINRSAQVSWEPDVLLDRSMLPFRIADHTAERSLPPKIGINLHSIKHRKAAQQIKQFCIDNKLNYKFLKSVQSCYRQYEYIDETPFLTISPSESSLRELAEFDVIISNKLHIGIAGISLGVPFISYTPQGKTAAQMQELGIETYCFKKGQFESLKASIYSLLSKAERKKYFYTISKSMALKPQNRSPLN